MSVFGESGLPPGFHADVMNAEPDGNEAKKKLAEEIKSRAKGSLSTKNYPEAIALYTKAIDVMQGMAEEDGYVAILFANRSMCKLGMNKSEEAESDASEAIKLDSSYVKGYYRKAMASIKLGKYESAKETLTAGLERKPEDKELTAQMDNVARLIKNPPKAETSKRSSNKTAASTTSKPAVIPKVSASRSTVPKEVKEETVIKDTAATEADKIRGYKLTSDGRKTSYFNNELDDQTKALIGDIAPKKISTNESSSPQPLSAGSSASGSAWNTAGTFESTNLTKWAQGNIKDRLIKCASHKDSISAVITSITSEGDAEIVVNRGKRKHIYDFTVSVKWTVTGQYGAVVKGSVNIQDVDADEDGDYEVSDYTVDDAHKVDRVDMEACNTLVKDVKSENGLLQTCFRQLDAFRAEFKAK